MYKAWDADSHVMEGERTFADPHWDPQFRDRRPVVVESDVQGNLSFMIDSRAFPTLTGPGQRLAQLPISKNGVPSPYFRQMVEMSARLGLVETVGSAEFHSAEDRLEQMDRERIGVQVNYPSILLSWPWAYDPKIGCAVARAYNSWIAEVSSQAPDRLKWAAAFDPANVEESVREIRRAKELGTVAIMFLGTVGNRMLDDPSLEPIWATAAALDLPVGVHAGMSCPALDNLYDTIFDAAAIPFGVNVMLGFHAVMRSGLLDRYPNLRVAFLENGSRWVDFLAGRITELCGKVTGRTTTLKGRPAVIDEAAVGGSSFDRPRAYASEFAPGEYIRRGQVFVHCEADERHLPLLIEEYGADFLLYAGDIPHGHRVANAVQKLQERTDLSDETKRKVLVENCARFYGLPVPELEPTVV